MVLCLGIILETSGYFHSLRAVLLRDGQLAGPVRCQVMLYQKEDDWKVITHGMPQTHGLLSFREDSLEGRLLTYCFPAIAEEWRGAGKDGQNGQDIAASV